MGVRHEVLIASRYRIIVSVVAVGSRIGRRGFSSRTTATRPAREHPEETSLPSNAPAATRTQTTGSNSQNPTTKRMNEEGLKKLQIEGK